MPNFSNRSLTNVHSFKRKEKHPDTIHDFIFCILQHVLNAGMILIAKRLWGLHTSLTDSQFLRGDGKE